MKIDSYLQKSIDLDMPERWQMRWYPEGAIRAFNTGCSLINYAENTKRDRKDIEEAELYKTQGKPLSSFVSRYTKYTLEELKKAKKVVKEKEDFYIDSAKASYKEMLAELQNWKHWREQYLAKQKKWWKQGMDQTGWLKTLQKQNKPFPKTLQARESHTLMLEETESLFKENLKEDKGDLEAIVYKVSDLMGEHLRSRIQEYSNPKKREKRRMYMRVEILRKFGVLRGDGWGYIDSDD